MYYVIVDKPWIKRLHRCRHRGSLIYWTQTAQQYAVYLTWITTWIIIAMEFNRTCDYYSVTNPTSILRPVSLNSPSCGLISGQATDSWLCYEVILNTPELIEPWRCIDFVLWWPSFPAKCYAHQERWEVATVYMCIQDVQIRTVLMKCFWRSNSAEARNNSVIFSYPYPTFSSETRRIIWQMINQQIPEKCESRRLNLWAGCSFQVQQWHTVEEAELQGCNRLAN